MHEVKSGVCEAAQALADRLRARNATVGIVGMGYVGLPLAITCAGAGFKVIGFDINEQRVRRITDGEQVINYLDPAAASEAIAKGQFEVTADFARLSEPDAIMICVPTPLTANREPDLSFVEATVARIAEAFRPGQLIVLESTTWPGTTREIVQPALEAKGGRIGETCFVAFSPEREDPGNHSYSTKTIPKIVGADDAGSLAAAVALYEQIIVQVVPVSSAAAAEAAKLTENIFRAVNIALVNELKVVYDAMGIDVWEVINAAATKPFGFKAFYPGPGLGGHCVPIDPFYLTWKAREVGVETRFIELAGQVNTAMPKHVVDKLGEALNLRFAKALNGSRVLVLGLAYKADVDDLRESPSLVLIDMLEARGATCDFHDPHIAIVPSTREHASLAGRESVALDATALADYDAVLVATDHKAVDYALIAEHARLVIDTRNMMERSGIRAANVTKA